MIFLVIIGCLCLLYYLMIAWDSGFTAVFGWFWLVLGAVAMVMAYIVKKMPKKLPLWMKLLAGFAGMLLVLFFFAIELPIIGAGLKAPEVSADYVVVLGAQVRGKNPSRILYERIVAAADYLKANPETKAVASGGQGSGEEISEARCIYDNLVTLGIDSERILMEDTSVNTEENLRNTLKITGKEAKLVIVTCNFHLYRAMEIAKKQGAVQVSGCAAKADPILALNYYVREFFAVVKYKITGQI